MATIDGNDADHERQCDTAGGTMQVSFARDACGGRRFFPRCVNRFSLASKYPSFPYRKNSHFFPKIMKLIIEKNAILCSSSAGIVSRSSVGSGAASSFRSSAYPALGTRLPLKPAFSDSPLVIDPGTLVKRNGVGGCSARWRAFSFLLASGSRQGFRTSR